MSARLLVLSLAIAVVAAGCRSTRGAPPSPEKAPPAATSVSAVVDAGPPAVPHEPLFSALIIPGYPDAVISLPNDATDRRPVVVAIHGSGDRPDWNCDAWRHITHARAFVVCPRGAYYAAWSTKNDARYRHEGPSSALEKHIDAVLASLRARFPDHADTERPLLTGFSLGAWQVAELAARSPARFPRVVMVEGGQNAWSSQRLRAFTAAGGARLLYACGYRGCTGEAARVATQLKGTNAEARAVFADVGHSYDRRMQVEIMKETRWLLEADPRFAGTYE